MSMVPPFFLEIPLVKDVDLCHICTLLQMLNTYLIARTSQFVFHNDSHGFQVKRLHNFVKSLAILFLQQHSPKIVKDCTRLIQ